MKIDLEELRKRNKYITEYKHTLSPIILWNYSQHCQFDGAWDEYTIQTRGLITDNFGNVIARPFKKFFNLGEKEETKIENLPLEVPEITEKIDGSLGIQYYIGDKVFITTRGSFDSEQGEFATKFMERFKKQDFKNGYTYLYEIIYPENRIVVNYGDRKDCVLLAVIETETGREIDFRAEAERLGLNCPKKINYTIEKLVELLPNLSINEEGFVVKYSNGLRVKMKGSEYLRLHKLITGFSTISIWDCLRNKQNMEDVLVGIPDEFYEWVGKQKEKLEDVFSIRYKKAMEGFKKVKNLDDRKSQALEIIKNYKEVSSEIFGLLDKKNIDEIIWKKLRPKYELPFKEQKEDV
jgi:RNA ligase